MFIEAGTRGGLRHDPFKACIVPRPIGWISTLDAAGVVNLAPFSFFNACSGDPPIVMFCPNGTHAEGGWKDSLANAQSGGEFVASLATWALREQVNLTSMQVGRGIDEMALAGLSPAASRLVRPPGVRESPIRLECTLLQVIELPHGARGATNHAVFGRVAGLHIDESVLTDGMVDMAKLQPIARLGYMEYAVVREVFRMERPRGEDPMLRQAAG